MSQLHAVVYLNGARYRLAGVSHDDSGSRHYYDSVEELEQAVQGRLQGCQRLDEAQGAEACWICAKDDDHYRIEAHVGTPAHH